MEQTGLSCIHEESGPRVRHKAIEIANALLDDGYEEGRSIAIATAKAEEWDENHPAPESSKSDPTSSLR